MTARIEKTLEDLYTEEMKEVYREGYKCGFAGFYENNYKSLFREAYNSGWDNGHADYKGASNRRLVERMR